MTVRERLHQLIDQLPETQVETVASEVVPLLEACLEESTDLSSFFALTDEIARNAPEASLAKFPADYTENADLYLYGSSSSK